MTPARLKQTLDAFLQRRMEEDHIPGVDCSVFHHHKEIYRFRAGYADIDSGTPITEHTLYNIYSNTKVITCTAALQLYEQGYFLLDDPVSRYFPKMAQLSVAAKDGGTVPAQRTMTIRDLFRMTSGIAGGGDPSVGRQFYEETGGACPAALLPDYIARVPLQFEPGTDYCYGISHEILAALIEKITGMTFGAYLKQNIFEPLGMNNTAFDLSDCASDQLATQYETQSGGQMPRAIGAKNCLIPPILRESASGGLISSVDDYMKFQEALCSGTTLLGRGTINLMRLDHLEDCQRANYGGTVLGWGYGLGVRTIIDQARAASPVGYGPFGWGGAAGTYGSIDPENEITVFYAQHIFGTNEALTHRGLNNIVYSALL